MTELRRRQDGLSQGSCPGSNAPVRRGRPCSLLEPAEQSDGPIRGGNEFFWLMAR